MTRFSGFASSSAAGHNSGSASMAQPAAAESNGDAMEDYFECITTCSLDDGICITECVTAFREKN
ncbi:hypothetical protein [Cyanobium sp. WAJ14-Wanaka]|uniref:hypothetical protein n=1 Tax=Cyanobium sp. WAJ14-Wanaka TaxID=2823725 RepID=UPI0020CEE217|nr:hypothetical protein [Cyanobium sp. WAJ14-Wanaka]MCP9776190.1 hypothetical protein [Cyanobium sp. WAJ14-Wanaka]